MQLCIEVSNLREQKFKHNSQHCLNPIYSCGLNFKSISHFLVHCPTFKARVCYVSLFLKDKSISSLFRTKYIEKKFNLVVFSSHCFTNIYSLLGYHVLPTSLKLLVLKNNCMCNRDNACDVAT